MFQLKKQQQKSQKPLLIFALLMCLPEQIYQHSFGKGPPLSWLEIYLRSTFGSWLQTQQLTITTLSAKTVNKADIKVQKYNIRPFYEESSAPKDLFIWDSQKKLPLLHNCPDAILEGYPCSPYSPNFTPSILVIQYNINNIFTEQLVYISFILQNATIISDDFS